MTEEERAGIESQDGTDVPDVATPVEVSYE